MAATSTVAPNAVRLAAGIIAARTVSGAVGAVAYVAVLTAR